MDKCSCIHIESGRVILPIKPRRMYVAERNYICRECERTILAGEYYEYFIGEYSDSCITRLCVNMICVDCLSLVNEFFCNGHAIGMVLDDVNMHVVETNGDVSSDCLLRLTPRARNIVIEMIDSVFDHKDDPNDLV